MVDRIRESDAGNLPLCLVQNIIKGITTGACFVWVLNSKSRLFASCEKVLFVVGFTVATISVVLVLEIAYSPHVG